MAMRHHHSDSGLKSALSRKVTEEEIFGEPSVIWPHKDASDWSKTDDGTKWQHGFQVSGAPKINGNASFEGESPCKGMGNSCASTTKSHFCSEEKNNQGSMYQVKEI